MRVGFDVSALVRPHSRGVERVVRGLVTALEKRGVLEVVRLAPADGADLRRWRARELGAAVRRERLIGLHSFTSAFAFRAPGRRVQTVHELPWRHGVRENADLGHRLWARFGPAFADRVVVPTEHVARDLANGSRAARAKLAVVPWGVDPMFADEPPAGEVDEVVLGRHRLGEQPFLLCLGAVRPKKDLAALLRGVAELKRRGASVPRVVISGPETAQLRADLGLASSLSLARWVATVGELPDPDLPALLRLASAVPVLSRSEGFGLPVLEALASGTPVLVPVDSAQAEVAGDAGIACDAADPASVADGIQRALVERESLRPRLVARARTFTWEHAAERVEELWRSLA